MQFWASRGDYPAAGLFSGEHFFMLGCCVTALIIFIYMTTKINVKKPYRLIRILSVMVLLLEILKVFWGVSASRYHSWYDYLPIWFCSLFIPFSLLAGFGKGRVQKVSLSFLYYGGLVGGCAYLMFPTTSLGRYPLWHFITLHSMFYHTMMIFVSVYVIRCRLVEPDAKDRRAYVCLVIIACVIADFVNRTLGTNYMFLAKPANNNLLLQTIHTFSGPFYPVVITLLQAYGSFYVALAVYRLYVSAKKQAG